MRGDQAAVVAERRRRACAVTAAAEVARSAPGLSAKEVRSWTAAPISPAAAADRAFEQLFQVDTTAATGALSGGVAAALLKLAQLDAQPMLAVGDGLVTLRFVQRWSVWGIAKLDTDPLDAALGVVCQLRRRWMPPARKVARKPAAKRYRHWPPPAKKR